MTDIKRGGKKTAKVAKPEVDKVNLDSRFRGQILSESGHIMFLTWLTITIHLPKLVSRGSG